LRRAPNRSVRSTRAIPPGRLRPACSDHRSNVFAGERFWEQDRLEMLEEAIVRSGTDDLGRTAGGRADRSPDARPVLELPFHGL
jgi:hypothetical protein